jgi:transcriptional regulator with XRE-family HTH domain
VADRIPIYDVESAEPPPLRSHLYHLRPIGIGTPFVESLTSYVSRLAEAHCVTLGDLMTYEIFPRYGRCYLPGTTEDHNTSAFWKDSPALNGTSPSAQDFIRALEQLTLRDNLRFLTMVPWAGVLSCRYLVRRTKAWCSVCYREWLEEGVSIYEPLLWALEAANICLKHAARLQTFCPHCSKRSTMLAAQGRPGYCPYCGAWLGAPTAQGNFHCAILTGDELNWQRYVLLTIGELLEASPALLSPPGKGSFAQAIEEYLEHSADGKVSVLARKLHLSRRTIRDWKRGLQIPQIESLLQCCYILDVSPLDLFNASVSMSRGVSQETMAEQIEVKGKVKKRYRALNVEAIRKELEAELLETEGLPSPMSAVARWLNYDHSFLIRHFPELCRAISERYRAYRKKKREERKQTILDEIRETTFSVHAQELYPSQERVRLRLTKPSSIKEPGALAAWHEALQELGWETRGT